MKKIPTTLAIAAAAVITIGVTASSTASSATTKLAAPASSQMNDIWAGYVAAYHGPYTKVEASWVQPAVTGLNVPWPTPRTTDIWVGIGGLEGSILGGPPIDDGGVRAPVQVGTHMDTNGSYTAWWVTPDHSTEQTISGFTVSPGDDILAGVDYSNGHFSMFLSDRTSGSNWSSDMIQDPGWPRNTAETIVESPTLRTAPPGLAPFNTVQWDVYYLGLCYKFETPDMSVSDISANHANFTVTHH